MNLEFHTPYKMVPENLVTETRNELLKLSHLSKNISRAEVWLRKDAGIILPENKICDIRITINGDVLATHTRSDNFEAATKEAIKVLKRLVRQQPKKINEPKGEISRLERV